MTNATISTNGRNGASANGSHPETVVPERELLWDSLPPAVTTKLAEPLDEGLVSHRKGRRGRSFAYLEGRVAIEQANRVFGHGGWGYDLDRRGRPPRGRERRPEDGGGEALAGLRRHRAGHRPRLAAAHRHRLPGRRRRHRRGPRDRAQGRGDGRAQAGAAQLRRASSATRLYGDGATGDLAPSLRKTLVDLGQCRGFDEAKVRSAVRERTGRDLDELPVAALTPLVEAAARKLQQDGAEETPKAA